ncbi:MAG: glycosyltransferase, partial [Anaerolineae bacterium]|nr:glycosyltransferase [Anaerolineae bacterium]
MHWLIGFLTLLYVLCALALAIYAAGAFVLLVIWSRTRASVDQLPAAPVADWPLVLVQLPVYNERLVIGRLIDAIAALDYPADRLRVQVLDDSTDDTAEVVARHVTRWQRAGLHIYHIRRKNRGGYKAGALADGLLRQPGAELVAIFDADFVPPPDFLRRVVPHFLADDRVGMAQTRWGHLNAGENALTRAQALSLDGHFVVEQTARSR